MPKIRFDKVGIRDGWLILQMQKEDLPTAKRFVFSTRNNKGCYVADIKEYRPARSMDANRLYWELAGKIAAELNMDVVEVYRAHIHGMSNYQALTISSLAVESFRRQWESDHIGRFVETRESEFPGMTIVLAYYGSSDFDTKKMSRLIDNAIQDCKDLGIETLPPEKIDLLKQEWGKNK